MLRQPSLPAGVVPRTASRLGSVVLDRSEFPEEEYDNEAEQPAVEFEHGFSLEYVIQIVRPGQGPHVMEIHLKGAQLQWPYVTQMDFVWDLANAYKHYFVRDWVMPYPEVLSFHTACDTTAFAEQGRYLFYAYSVPYRRS